MSSTLLGRAAPARETSAPAPPSLHRPIWYGIVPATEVDRVLRTGLWPTSQYDYPDLTSRAPGHVYLVTADVLVWGEAWTGTPIPQQDHAIIAVNLTGINPALLCPDGFDAPDHHTTTTATPAPSAAATTVAPHRDGIAIRGHITPERLVAIPADRQHRLVEWEILMRPFLDGTGWALPPVRATHAAPAPPPLIATTRPAPPSTAAGPAPPQSSVRPRLYVGAPEPSWLGRFAFPMLVSRARLARLVRKFPTALASWMLDSSGYNHIRKHGRWMITPEQYAEEVQFWMEAIGRMVAAAPLDWMCEEDALRQTGKSIPEHQELTTANLLRLRELAPAVPWMPVLQGWRRSDYVRHIEMYAAAGIDLTREPRVGVGSICRRQNSVSIALLIDELAARGLRLHGFGVKIGGLEMCGEKLVSVDSAAWSDHARHQHDKLPDCTHADCRNCPAYAAAWRDDLIDRELVR
ncbi:deazapurine DNA modification protein DpdA family protein [Streptosporangium sandarakinum]